MGMGAPDACIPEVQAPNCFFLDGNMINFAPDFGASALNSGDQTILQGPLHPAEPVWAIQALSAAMTWFPGYC